MSFRYCSACRVHYAEATVDAPYHATCPNYCPTCGRLMILGRALTKADCPGHFTRTGRVDEDRMTYVHCEGCNTSYVPGCGEEEYHARCPHDCSMCGKPMRAGGDAEYGWCPSHSADEAREFYRRLRERGT